jgi:CubicO group peptidase (beta-lactamase class C family)
VTHVWASLGILAAACATPAGRAPPQPVQPMPLVKINWQPVVQFLDSAVAAGAAPGAVVAVSRAGQRFIHGTGQLGSDEPHRPGPTTIYDLASLTKVVGLATAAMFAVQDGSLDLEAPVQRYLPAFDGPGKQRVSIRMLLAHTSGLPAWRPLFREVDTREAAFALAATTPLETAPGSLEVYSDLGAIVLTQIIESIYHERIDSLLQRRLFQPLGLSSTGFLPPPDWRDRIAPTELDLWRGRVLRGEVHDENAALMDGVSGHAGLFGSAEDLLTFAEWMIEGWNEGTRERGNAGTSERKNESAVPSLPRSLVREFTRRPGLARGSNRALGWDTPSQGGSAGSQLSRNSFGHTGFTGTSLWIDPEHDLAIVLLSNRVNPTRDNPRWTPVRAGIADLVMTTLIEDAR